MYSSSSFLTVTAHQSRVKFQTPYYFKFLPDSISFPQRETQQVHLTPLREVVRPPGGAGKMFHDPVYPGGFGKTLSHADSTWRLLAFRGKGSCASHAKGLDHQTNEKFVSGRQVVTILVCGFRSASFSPFRSIVNYLSKAVKQAERTRCRCQTTCCGELHSTRIFNIIELSKLFIIE